MTYNDKHTFTHSFRFRVPYRSAHACTSTYSQREISSSKSAIRRRSSSSSFKIVSFTSDRVLPISKIDSLDRAFIVLIDKKVFNLNCGANVVTVVTRNTRLPITDCSNFSLLQSYNNRFGSNRRSVHTAWNGYVGRGQVVEVELVNPGSGYPLGGTGTIFPGQGSDGFGTGLSLDVAYSSGQIISLTINDPGEDYSRDLTGTFVLPGGNNDATFIIKKVSYPKQDAENFKFLNCNRISFINYSQIVQFFQTVRINRRNFIHSILHHL